MVATDRSDPQANARPTAPAHDQEKTEDRDRGQSKASVGRLHRSPTTMAKLPDQTGRQIDPVISAIVVTNPLIVQEAALGSILHSRHHINKSIQRLTHGFNRVEFTT